MKFKHLLPSIFLAVVAIAVYSCTAAKAKDTDKKSNSTMTDSSTDKKVKELLSKMTLEEKIGQMNQYTGFFDPTGPAPKGGNNEDKYEQVKKGLVGSMLNVRGAKQVRAMQKIAVENSRLGIPLVFAFDVIHGFKTTAPIPLAESASWDLEAIEKSARMAAIEASAAGLNWTFAPMVDIGRDARWGRVMEGAGEDPFLGSKIGVARIKGFQGNDLSANNTIAACAKHFAGYAFAESGKDYNTADVGTSTLHNIILPPFKAAAEANVSTFMNSFNELNGIPATGDKFLQRDILKGKWNYKGFVVSDWGSIGEMIDHGYAADGKHATEIAANAGSDMDMESHLYIKHLKDLVESGKVDISKIDDAVSRILKLKFELGLFDDPYRYCDEAREKTLTYNEDQMEAALDMAKKSIVLLKNEKNMLPLPKSGKNIAVIGPLADDKNSPLGNWRLASDNNTATSVLEGLKAYEGNNITHASGVKFVESDALFHMELKINETDRTGIKEAVEVAKKADVVIMVLGEHGFQSGEGRSRADIGLPGLQQELLEAVYKENKNIVLVLMNGRPLAIPSAVDMSSAIVEAWQLGIKTGDAVAQVLYGDHNPSGKLPMTFPRSVGQVPIYYNYKKTGRPGPKSEVFWQHYTDESNSPLFHFGHGLSYTNFAYFDLKVAKNDAAKTVTVSFTLENTGVKEGAEVAQLYIRDRVGSVTRPVKELKGFEKVMLTPGESKTITFTLTEKELGFYDNQGAFVVEAGDFDVMVGGSSENTVNAKFQLTDAFVK
ncbi:MAG: beta-glucosidase BglX [Saprospiraceae bacterium]